MFSSIFDQVAALSVGDTAKLAVSGFAGGVKGGAAYLKEGVNAKLTGTRRTVKTPTGPLEVVEVGLISDSPHIMKVRCTGTGVEFALKRMEVCNGDASNPESQSGLVELERLTELADRAELLPQLQSSKHLVRCLGSQSDNSNRVHAQLLLFELCEESLASVLAQQGSLSSKEVLQLLQDLADGLNVIHTTNEGSMVVHGSVQPEHIMRGKSGEWKLGSFGKCGVVEQSSAAKNDIWQFGIVLFMALFGVHPFESSADESKPGGALPIPRGRPVDELEGRLCLMLHWLLAAEPSMRPSAKEVCVMADYLGTMSPNKIHHSLPPTIRQSASHCTESLVVLEYVDMLQSVDPSDRRALANKFGEDALLKPGKLSESVLEKMYSNNILPRSSEMRMRDIKSFMGCGEVASKDENLEGLAKDLALARHLSGDKAEEEKPPVPAPMFDLLDFGNDMIDLEDAKPEEPKQATSPLAAFDPLLL